MFTGIVSGVGIVKAASKKGCLTLRLPGGFRVLKPGASVACDGVCLTVAEVGTDWLSAEVSSETLRCTTIGDWKQGRKVNLEPALRVGDALGGHFVTGHVDGIATLGAMVKKGSHVVWELSFPRRLSPLVAAKGSVTLDGVSLTVNMVKRGTFSVNIVPHTLRGTHFSGRRTGDRMNLEVDIVARYAYRMMQSLSAS